MIWDESALLVPQELLEEIESLCEIADQYDLVVGFCSYAMKEPRARDADRQHVRKRLDIEEEINSPFKHQKLPTPLAMSLLILSSASAIASTAEPFRYKVFTASKVLG